MRVGVIGHGESVFFHSPDTGFLACLWDLPPDMSIRSDICVSLGNLLLKLRGISRSSVILESDSPQSDNRKGNSIHSSWETWCQHTLLPVIQGYHGLHQRMHSCGCCIGSAVEQRNQCTALAIRRSLWPDMRRLQLPLDDGCRLVLS